MDDVQTLAQVFQTVGLWAIFAWLYIDERRQHAKTRQELTERIRDVITDHMHDLREIAGMRANLNRIAGLAQQAQEQQVIK